jgi:peptide deformylase
MNKIVTWPNPILNKRSELVETIDETVKECAKLLTEELILSRGLGLSACQIGVDKTMFAFLRGDKVEVVINPQIIYTSDDPLIYKKEGCLSIPDATARVGRAIWIEINYRDLDNVFHIEKFYDIEARVVQHEMDHLMGITILDRIPKITKKLLLDKYYKRKGCRQKEYQEH